MAPKPFFFDIEAGGLDPKKSSILSISSGTTSKNISSSYAKPEGFLSRWSEKNVWEPVKGMAGVKKEREVLQGFLGKLEGLPKGSVVAGWNVGYTARPGARGYDIPFIMQRAERYGLEQKFSSAFSRLRNRDIGQEYAYQFATEVAGREDLVEKGLLPKTLQKEALGYAKAGMEFSRPGRTGQQISRDLAESWKYMSGWKQEPTYGLLTGKKFQAHLSAEDVRTGIHLSEQIDKGKRLLPNDKSIVRWGRETYYNSLVSQSMKPAGIRQGVQEIASEKYFRIMGEAETIQKTGGSAYKGFVSRVEKGIAESAAERGVPMERIFSGLGAPEKEAGRWIAAEAPSRFSALWKHKGKIAIGAGLLGLFATKPLSLFSGKDDEYNTIEGLPHGGQAQRMRRILTEFGSGWDPLRRLIREGVGETFGTMLKGKSFQKALGEAVEVDELGRGAYGAIKRMKGTFRGQEFQFARKQALPGQTISKQEVDIMTKLHEQSFRSSPSVYGHRTSKAGQQLDIELFEGMSLEKFGPQEAELFRSSTKKTLQELHKQGVEHLDPHLGNIMLVQTPTGVGEIGLIDYGFARRLADTPLEETGAFGKYDIAFFDKFLSSRQAGKEFQEAYGSAAKVAIQASSSKVAVSKSGQEIDDFFAGTFSGESPAASPIKSQSWYELHKKSMRQSSKNALRPGRQHVHKAGKIVR